MEENLNLEKEDETKPKKQKKMSKIHKVVIVIVIIGIFALSAVGLIIAFTIKREKKSDGGDDDDSYYELDTIPKEEMDRARKSFKQYRYEKDSKIIDYNFYIPENISKDDYYPLVVFISDRSLVGQEITAPLTKTVGGPIWATDTVQKKHKCFVLVPQYNETISENHSEYVEVTIGLIQEIQDEYNIDKKRIYGTGQSMGAMVLLYYLANHPYLYTAGLIVDGHWELEELHGLVNATFTYFAAEGDPNPYKCQNEVREFFNSSGVIYYNMDSVDAQAKVETLNEQAANMYNKGSNKFFITYKNGTVINGTDQKSEHMASFKYGYRIETVRDWLFEQIKY